MIILGYESQYHIVLTIIVTLITTYCRGTLLLRHELDSNDLRENATLLPFCPWFILFIINFAKRFKSP